MEKELFFMKNIITGRNIDITDAIRATVDKKMSRLDKYFQNEMMATVTLNVEKLRQIVEVTIPISGTIVRAEESTDDMYTSIDKVIDVLERQIRRHKEKLKDKKHTRETIRFENIADLPVDDVEEEGKVVKVKRFPLKPMDEEEAILQMELLRHAFFVFRNGETGEVNVVYKRKDGHYGLIEPQE
jgi:putative sigma-54 modulation protein